jgi:hypothetical protein
VTAKRVAAFLIAAALIVAAILIRNGLDDNSSDSTDGTSQPTGGKQVVICSTEFESVCNQLDDKKYDVTTEPAGTTLDALAKDGATLPDAWITLDPFPGMIDVMRGIKSLSPTTPTVVAVATDAPELAVAKAVSDGVTIACGGPVTWKCLGTNGGKALDQGGKLLPGITDPDQASNGLLTFANAVAGYFGNTDFDTNAWQDGAFVGWLRNFHTKSKMNVAEEGAVPLSTLLTRKTTVNVAATTASEAAKSPQSNLFTVVPVTPAIQYVAVVATFGTRARDLAPKVGPLLVSAGWMQASDPAPHLKAGTFVALRRLWEGK